MQPYQSPTNSTYLSSTSHHPLIKY